MTGPPQPQHTIWFLEVAVAFWCLSGLFHQASSAVWVWAAVALGVVAFCVLQRD